MKSPRCFTHRLLPCFISAIIASHTQAQNEVVEEVLVSGVRSAQEKAIDIKRNSAEVVDAVAAEDIGKLPDTTIADSLQRITGLQIQRTAGQGGVVSIRGVGQVAGTLNGEYFLTASSALVNNVIRSSLTSNGVNFTDVPASLVSGLNVSKSQSASQLEGGIGGSIDIVTRRALELDEGFSGAARLQASSGNITKETDPELSGLLGWNYDDRIASSLAFSYGDSTLASNQGRLRSDRVNEGWGCNSSCEDLDRNGVGNGDFINPMSWNSPELSAREVERERLGLAYNFNMDVTDVLELNADFFYTDMDEKAAGQFIYLGNQIGGRAGFHDYSLITDKPAIVNPGDGTLAGQPFYATDMYMMTSGFRGGVLGDYRESTTNNFNLELKYDSGESFTGSVRYATGDAEEDRNSLTLAQVSNPLSVARTPGGAPVNINPDAIDDGLIYPMHVKLNSRHIDVDLDQAIIEKMKNPAAWYLHSGWVESNQAEADFDVVRADGNYQFDDEGIISVDMGVRIASRSTTNNNMSFFSPSGVVKDGVELLNKFHQVGYALDQAATPGTAKGLTHDPLPVIEVTDSVLDGDITHVTDFGEALKGLNLSIPMIDTHKIDDPIAFMDKLYGKGERIINPDRSYKVEEDKQSAHVRVNFDQPLNEQVSISGNAGVRYVKTELTITQNLTDPNQLNPRILAGVDPNHTSYVDLGDLVTEVKYNHVLPSINFNFNIADDYKIKLAFDKRLSLQNLNDLGEGSIIYYDSEIDGEDFQRVDSRQNNGNPRLKPWEANVFNIAGEWYPTDSTILSLGYFNIDIESFTFSSSELNPSLADSDGQVRLGGEERTITNGKGGKVHGWEFAYQQSFDFLPGLLSNTGITFNYTYSPSKSQNNQRLPDDTIAPFNNTAKDQANLILWYQDDRFETRIAANYLGEQYQGLTAGWFYTPPNGASGMPRYLKETLFVDVNAAYHISDSTQITLAINNLTEEDNITYTQWSDFIDSYDIFERRITAGINVKF